MGEKIANNLKGGEVLALRGALGAGKTTFVQGVAKILGIDQRVISPTFIIMRKYDIPLIHQPKGIKYFYHIDLYRLEGAVESELKNIGAPSIWGKIENVVAIEWAEKVTGMYPQKTIRIKFENVGGKKRKITINNY